MVGGGGGEYVCNNHVVDETVCFVFPHRQMLVLP